MNGKNQNVLPREVIYDVLSDEPIHIDFMRVVAGKKIILEMVHYYTQIVLVLDKIIMLSQFLVETT